MCWGPLRNFKDNLSQTPVLAFADFKRLFLLETDVNKLRLGAVLRQKQTDGQYYLIAYASHSLTVHEHNYHSTKQEFPVLQLAITSSFKNTFSGSHSLSRLTTTHSLV